MTRSLVLLPARPADLGAGEGHVQDARFDAAPSEALSAVESPEGSTEPLQPLTSGRKSVDQNLSKSSERSCEQYPEEVWKSHKATIHGLYIENGLSLKEVMETMKARYGFRPTAKMYKSRFRGWRFVKNNNRKDVAAMLRAKAARSAAGKGTAFYRNGKVIELDRYLRFAIAAQNTDADSTTSGALPTYIRASTPPALEVHHPQYLRAPEHLLPQELILHALRFLAWGSHDQHEPLVDRINSYISHPVCQVVSDLTDDVRMSQYKQAQRLDVLRRRAMGSLHRLVQAPSPCALLHFLFCHLSTRGELLGEAWHLLAKSQNTQPPHDPVSSFYQATNRFLCSNGFAELQGHILHILSRLVTTDEGNLDLPAYTTSLLAGFKPPGNFSTGPAMTLGRQLVSLYHTDHLQSMRQQPGLGKQQRRGLLCYELRIIGQQSRWRSEMVNHLANEILDLATRPLHVYACWQAKRAIASYHRAKFEDEAPAPSPHHGLARMYLEETIHLALSLDCMNRGLDVVPDIRLLETWSAEVGDMAKTVEVRSLLQHVLAESSAFLLEKA